MSVPLNLAIWRACETCGRPIYLIDHQAEHSSALDAVLRRILTKRGRGADADRIFPKMADLNFSDRKPNGD